MAGFAYLICLWVIPEFVGVDKLYHRMLLLGCYAVWGLALAVTSWVRYHTLPKFDATEIARLGGAKAVVPLFAVLENDLDNKQREAIRDALIPLLPQMKASDALLLTPAARHMLIAWISLNNDDKFVVQCAVDLRLSVLKALEQVGDSGAIPVVERLANRRLLCSGDKEIRQAAIECLPMLRANCGDVETARTLLRASQAEPTDSATLLRPVSHTPETNPAQLLRGSHSPDA